MEDNLQTESDVHHANNPGIFTQWEAFLAYLNPNYTFCATENQQVCSKLL